MFTKAKWAVALSMLSVISHSVMAQSLQNLRAQMKSMEACRQSIKHADCNLQILDKDLRDTLVQLDQFNQQQQSQQEGGATKSSTQGNVRFFTSTISEANGEILKMMDGSTWRLDRNYFGLILQDAIGVMSDQRNAVIYADDNSYGARLLSGVVSTSSGSVRTVVETMGEGTILKLDDGALLEFSSYDKYDTGWWLPPYKVLVDSTSMNMWNLRKGKKVWIQRTLR